MTTDTNKNKALEFLNNRAQKRKEEEETKNRAISFLQNRSAQSGTDTEETTGKTPVIREVRSSEDAKRAKKTVYQKPNRAASQLVNKWQGTAADIAEEARVSAANDPENRTNTLPMSAKKRNTLYQAALETAQAQLAQEAAAQEAAEAEKLKPAKAVQAQRSGLSARQALTEEDKPYQLGEVRSQQGRLGSAAQSIGLNTVGSVEILGEGVKTSRDNIDAYNQSGYAEQAEEALNKIKLAKTLYGEDSAEYQQAQADYSALRQEIMNWRGENDQAISQDSRGYQIMQAAAEKQAEALDGLEGTARFLASTGLSVADNLSSILLSGGNPAVSLAMMSAKAAAGRTKELTDEGVAAGQALTRGAVAGAIEAATEKMGLDNLMDLVKVGGKSALVSLLKQAGIEGTEEGFSYLFNYLADKLAKDPNAEFDVNDLAEQIASGAVSGLMFGVGGTVVNALGNYGAEAQTDTQTDTQTDPAMEQAIELLRQGAQTESTPVVAENATTETSVPAVEENTPVSATENAQERSFEPEGETVSGADDPVMAVQTDSGNARSAEQIARDIQRVQEAASALGENGSRALSTVYADESVSGQYSPEDIVGGFYAVYNNAMNGTSMNNSQKAQAAALPDSVRFMAETAGMEDARRAAQAQYFGKDSKLVRDDNWKKANLSSKTSRKVDALAKVLGVQVKFVQQLEGGTASGEYRNGVISVALDSDSPVMSVVLHESVHRLREISPEGFNQLSEYVKSHMSAGQAALNQNIRKGLYQTNDVSAVNEETVADAFGVMLNDSGLLEQFAREHTTVLQRMADSIRDMVRKVRRDAGMEDLKLSETEKAAFSDLANDLAGMEKVMRDALRTVESQSANKNTAQTDGGNGNVKYKLVGKNRYGIEVYETSAQVKKLTWAERKKQFIDLMTNQYRGRTAKFIRNGHSYYASFEASDINKNIYGDRRSDASGRDAKIKAGADGDVFTLVENAKYDGSKAESGKNIKAHQGVAYWDYFLKKVQIDGTVFDLLVNVRKKAGGQYVYSLQLNEDKNTKAAPPPASTVSSKASNGAQTAFTDTNVSQTTTNVKPKFKLKQPGENSADTSISEMEQSLSDMNTEYRSLEKQDAEFQTAPEYTALMDAISDGRASKRSLLDKPEALKQALDAYSAWQESSGYSTVIHRMEELRGEMKTLRGKLDSAKEQAAKEAKTATRAGYSESMAKSYATKAARKFGTTTNFELAGYLTTNGTLLDFSDRQGYRVRDHREITEVLDFLPENHGYSDGMIEFMNLGNIRLQSYGIDISKAPNMTQRSMLRKFFQSKNGEITVDFSDEDGRSVGSLEYNRGTRADRILNDIDTYFETGGIPDQSVVSQFHGKYSKSTRAALEEYIKQYGELPRGEAPARDVILPSQTADDRYVSQTVRTILEAGATPDALVPTVEQLVADGDLSFERISDEQAMAEAEKRIRNVGWADALTEWTADMNRGVVSKQNTAMGWALYNNAANSGDTKTAITILNRMVGSQRSAAQALQATRILKKLSPEAQLYQVQRSVANLQEEINNRYGKKGAPELVVNEDLAAEFMKADTQEERDAALRDIYRDIGRQMPSNFRDKWNAWRYLAMLGNPRTHVRNIVGNLGFVPVVEAKNLTATAIEQIVSGVSGGKLNRTKSLVLSSKQGRALLKAAWGDYAKVQETAMSGGKYSDLANANQYIEEGRQIFKFKPLEKLRKGNSAALDAEDVWFSQPHYAYALASYAKAHNISAETIQKGGKAMEQARAYAVLEAQKATYRDTNAFSQMVSGLGRVSASDTNRAKKGWKLFAEGVLPFRKTPANILVRGIEYSPLGLVQGVKQALVDVKSGKVSGAQAIDRISAGLTGTGLMALGAYLVAEGVLRGHGSGEEDENEFEELMGHQAYALELSDGTSVTLDWLAPEALPFFIGANLYEQTNGEVENLSFSAVVDAISTITEPLLEMSMLQSLNDLFDSVGYASSSGLSGLPSAAASAATSYLTQALPTLLGQIERTAENTRYTTYTDKTNRWLTTDMQYTIGKASARVPGLEYQQIPYIDAWGREESTGEAWERALNNFVNPAYTSQISESAMEQELLRLYDETGESGVFPSRAAKYFTVNGERKDLTAEEYVQYAQEKGQTAYQLVTELVESKAYQALSDADKAEAVKEAYDYANQTAKQKIDSAYSMGSWITKAQEAEKTYGISQSDYITLKIRCADIESLKDKNGNTLENSKGLQIMELVYNTEGLTEKQRKAMFEYLGVGKTIQKYNKALVSRKLEKLRKQAQ